jgi:transposase InsO family protein
LTAGPIQLRLGTTRSKIITKGYIAIFVCFVTRAVHIEVVTSLTTEAFLAALRHFIPQRGKPRTVYSDNGNNFQGASNQLREVYTMLQSSSKMARVQDFLTTEGCDWNFIPPHAPHFSGLWEAALKSMKHHLRRTLGLHIPTYEELYTLLTETEACLSSAEVAVCMRKANFVK